jgi:hypothetical protein
MEFIRGERRKIRKVQTCWGCREPLPIGTIADAITSSDNGKIFTTYYCVICTQIMNDAPDHQFNDGIGFGDLEQEKEEFKKGDPK